MRQRLHFTPAKRVRNMTYNRKSADDYDVRDSISAQKKSQIGSGLELMDKLKPNPSYSLEKVNKNALELAKTSMMPTDMRKDLVKLPVLPRRNSVNPEDRYVSPIKKKKTMHSNKEDSENKESKTNVINTNNSISINIYYQKKLERAVTKHETTYMMNLFRQHFYQCIEVLRFGKEFKVPAPKKVIAVPKKNPEFKTIFLDLDETLIHCDERSSNYSVKLNFPLEKGGIIAAGVRIRPFCREFLEELSKFAEIMIFTASSASYADVILDYLDPKRELISHRLYRHNCTLERGFYLKDLRIINRPLENVALVDNSAYCHIIQPENGIPIVPFFHYTKDRELESLLEYLRVLVREKDMRSMLKDTFFYHKYVDDKRDPRKVFLHNIGKMDKHLEERFINTISTEAESKK